MARYSVAIECKIFELREEYEGNLRVVCIIEHGKAFFAFIHFWRELVGWFCEALDMACRETDTAAIIHSTDDNSRVILIKGRSNALGSFLKCLEIRRNGKEFSIFLLRGVNAMGWENVALALRRSFGNDPAVFPSPPVLSSPAVFPPVVGEAEFERRDHNLSVELLKWEKDWAIHIHRHCQLPEEEVWDRVVVCYRSHRVCKWLEIAGGLIFG